MQFKLTVDLDNAAFAGNIGGELGAVFARVTSKLGCGYTEGKVLDTNGNTVGHFELTGVPEPNIDQSEAEDVCWNDSWLRRVGQSGDEVALEAELLDYVSEHGLSINTGNVDYEALVAFLRD